MIDPRMRTGLAGLLLGALLVGCAPSTGPSARSTVGPSEPAVPQGPDASAERLHDVCGSLLLFHASQGRLPDSLAELAAATGLEASRTLDPATGRPFAYARGGFAASAEGASVVVLAEPAPGAAVRWAVAFEPGRGASTCRVVALPASSPDPAARPADTPPPPGRSTGDTTSRRPQ